MKFLAVSVCITGLLYYFVFRSNPAIYKSEIVFKDPVKAVQDSMRVLRQLCGSIDENAFLTFNVMPDSNLYFNVYQVIILESNNLGRIDTVSTANKGFADLETGKVVRLLSLLKFLNRNLINGIVHDPSTGYWWYPYGTDKYGSIHWLRHLYLCDTPADTLKPSFKYYFNIIDRKGKVLLAGFNNVYYREFN